MGSNFYDSTILGEVSLVGLVIQFIEKGSLSLVFTNNDVIEKARSKHTRAASHDSGFLPATGQIVKVSKSDLTASNFLRRCDIVRKQILKLFC